MVPGLAADAVSLGQLITMKTAECEGVEPFGEGLDAVRLAHVLTSSALPNSTHNQIARIDAGPLGEKTVVCGAPNCRADIVTAYVPPGTGIAGRAIGIAMIEGVQSEGMLASAADLGIGRDHTGILELAGQPGDPLPQLGTDNIIEIDNKSLTHRPDLWGHYGMAREVAAITSLPLTDPVDISELPAGPGNISVSIEDFTLCPRYSALVFENVTVQPSPLWLQARLTSIGLNPINNIVDVTNFLMAELAQPMHAFDADKLHGQRIVVRPAHPGESILALNGETYALTEQALVIADTAGPVAIAGIIGGDDSAISNRTTRIVLESANFQASSVRKTSSRLKLRTDASMRFEKAQDPVNTTRALARAITLLREVSPGIQVVGGVADEYRPLPAPAPVDLPLEWLNRKLGKALEESEVQRILESLGFGVTTPSASHFHVTIPSWRATKDITIKDDLVEEVGRMIGYGSITPTAPLVPARVPFQLPFRMFLRHVRQTVADQGFHEVYNYSFVNEELISRFGFPTSGHVGVANPIAADQTLLRTSLLPRIWLNIEENRKHSDEFRLFEIGREIHAQETELPRERTYLVAVLYRRDEGDARLLEVKRLADCLRPGITARPTAARSFEHPARAATIHADDTEIGRLFELHPSLVEQGRAAILEIDLQMLEQHPRASRYQPIRRTPSSSFDLSVIANSHAYVGDLESLLRTLAGPLLDNLQFLQVYTGPPIPEGRKSVSYRLTVADRSRTLSSDEVNAIRARVIEGVQAAGYSLTV